MCEEFHCTPLEALEQPYELCLTIIHMRGYASAKQQLEQAKRESDVPITPLVREVGQIKLEVMRAQREAKRQV